MTQPKANWSSIYEKYWDAFIGQYRLTVMANIGEWLIYNDDAKRSGDMRIVARGEVSTPCDDVVLMLAAESALATHLRAVADTMTWPEDELDDEREEPVFSAELSRPINVFDDNVPRAFVGKLSFASDVISAAILSQSVRVEGERPIKHPADEARFFADFGGPMNSDQTFTAFDMFTNGAAYDEVRSRLVPVHVNPAPKSPPMYKIENNGPTAIYVPPGDGEVISNTGESTIYVRGMRIAPGVKLTFKQGVAMPDIGCTRCLQGQVGPEHDGGCPYTREAIVRGRLANNKKPPTPEGTGGGR